MNKIHSICTLALMLPLCAFAQYDGTPMNKTGDTKKAETAVRTDKYPHSDNDWENFDVLHINRLPSAAMTNGPYITLATSEEPSLSGVLSR